ncbi:MAG: cell division protein FtsZ [Cytophagales bacterium]|nr:cell division protein FtsZ [Cytophagales bacterium]
MEKKSDSNKSYKFDLPAHHKSIIKVIGVGGGGGNAASHMYDRGIKDVEFVICNTDMQALNSSAVPDKLQLGVALTGGLGAGGNPETGREAANESIDEIKELFEEHTRMVFITAGMGGGTGTGGAPIIAKEAKDRGILTVAIVTTPLKVEGKEKAVNAFNGIKELKENVDAIIVVSNEKMREIYGNSTITEGFAQADDILTTAAKSIAEIITVPGKWNLDFADVNRMMKDSGIAMIGSATEEGENRAMKAAETALKSPLLNENDIQGTKNILLSISYGTNEPTIDEITEIGEYIISEARVEEHKFKLGLFPDESLDDKLCVTVIATGFGQADDRVKKTKIVELDPKKQFDMFDGDIEMKQSYVSPHEPRLVGKEFEDRKDEPEIEKSEEAGSRFNQSERSVDPGISGDEPFRNEVKKKPEERSKETITKLKDLTNLSMDSDEFKNMVEIPAYVRRKIKLQDISHSSETEVSRYNLNEDDELLGNNKFLHDNVD